MKTCTMWVLITVALLRQFIQYLQADNIFVFGAYINESFIIFPSTLKTCYLAVRGDLMRIHNTCCCYTRHTIVAEYYGFTLDVRVSVSLSACISFPYDNLSKHQWIFTMCIDIVEIWFGITNGQISSNFDGYLPETHPYFHFWTIS